MKTKLTSEESLLDKQISNNEWKPVLNKNILIKKFKIAARNTMIKDQRMNIRIAKRDMDSLKTIAAEDGIPYQTLVSSVLHKFVTGRLVEK